MVRFLVILVLLFLGKTAQAQSSRFEDEGQTPSTPVNADPPQVTPQQSNTAAGFWQRTRFGGNFGLQLGNPTFINVSPRMYYLVTQDFWVGGGATYMYTRYKAPFSPFETSTYGANITAIYQVFAPIFLQAEYEPLNFEAYNAFEGVYNRTWIHGVLVGGGITQRVGRGAIFLTALYNVTWKDANRSFYGSPWIIRVGFGL